MRKKSRPCGPGSRKPFRRQPPPRLIWQVDPLATRPCAEITENGEVDCLGQGSGRSICRCNVNDFLVPAAKAEEVSSVRVDVGVEGRGILGLRVAVGSPVRLPIPVVVSDACTGAVAVSPEAHHRLAEHDRVAGTVLQVPELDRAVSEEDAVIRRGRASCRAGPTVSPIRRVRVATQRPADWHLGRRKK
jgi:hypothetical protein